jgi:hypothetical protein
MDKPVACPRCGKMKLHVLDIVLLVDHHDVVFDGGEAVKHEDSYWPDYWDAKTLDNGAVVCVGPPDYANAIGCGARWNTLADLNAEIRAKQQAEYNWAGFAITHT